MSEQIYNASIGATSSDAATYDFDRPPVYGDEAVFFITGDANGTDVSWTVEVQPNSVSSEWFSTDGEGTNVDLSGDGERVDPTTRGAGSVRLSITNNGAAASTITLHVEEVKE